MPVAAARLGPLGIAVVQDEGTADNIVQEEDSRGRLPKGGRLGHPAFSLNACAPAVRAAQDAASLWPVPLRQLTAIELLQDHDDIHAHHPDSDAGWA